MMKLALPIPVEEIFHRFDKIHCPVFLVGGCVRDHIMGNEPHDYDFTTPLTPEEIVALFPDSSLYTVGAKYGTIGVVTELGPVEITTYRVDGTYRDHRRPEEVSFTTDLTEDLSRRDFTINAMAYHPEEGIIDLFSGQEHIREKRIVAIGEPADRLAEDAIRILRAIRFMGRFDFALDPNLAQAMYDERHLIEKLSLERIQMEMDQIMVTERPSRALYKMVELEILPLIYPELMDCVGYDQNTPYHDKTLFDHILCVVDHVPAKLHLRYAALFHDIEKPTTYSYDVEKQKAHFFGHDVKGAETAGKILTHYRHSKKMTQAVSTLVGEHMKLHEEMSDKALRRQIHRVGEDLILDLYDLMMGDMQCTKAGREWAVIQERKKRIEELLEEEPEKKKLAISGKDLIEMGMEPGPEMGKILKKLENIVIEEPSQNQREILLPLAREWTREREVE